MDLTKEDKENILEWHDLSVNALCELYNDQEREEEISTQELKEKTASWLKTLQKLQKSFSALPSGNL
jgi:hypothetical protein